MSLLCLAVTLTRTSDFVTFWQECY